MNRNGIFTSNVQSLSSSTELHRQAYMIVMLWPQPSSLFLSFTSSNTFSSEVDQSQTSCLYKLSMSHTSQLRSEANCCFNRFQRCLFLKLYPWLCSTFSKICRLNCFEKYKPFYYCMPQKSVISKIL